MSGVKFRLHANQFNWGISCCTCDKRMVPDGTGLWLQDGVPGYFCHECKKTIEGLAAGEKTEL